MKSNSKVFKYGDHVDTDVIIPARYLSSTQPKELAKHCMEDIDTTFASKVKEGDIIVGGINFGCGSSREHAPLSIIGSGVSCVIAKSFARIFFRNCINTGLAIVECPEAVDSISFGDEVKVDTDQGIIENITTGQVFKTQPFPAFLQEIIKAGGLVKSIAKKAE